MSKDRKGSRIKRGRFTNQAFLASFNSDTHQSPWKSRPSSYSESSGSYPVIGTFVPSGSFSKRHSRVDFLLTTGVKKSLIRSYAKQLAKFPEYIQEQNIAADNIFHTVTTFLSRWKTLNAKVSITESPSLFFKALFFGGYELRFEVFIVTINAAFSIYKAKELVARSHGPLPEMLSEIGNFFNPSIKSTTEITIPEVTTLVKNISEEYIFLDFYQTADTRSSERFLEHVG